MNAPIYSRSEGPAQSVPVSYKLPASFQQSGPITITYDYDPLYRLKEANYSIGDTYHIYGLDRIAQVNSANKYFLGDALGSVRQLTDQSGEVTYASAYDPYGVTTSTAGESQSTYRFTNEYTVAVDSDNHLLFVYLADSTQLFAFHIQ